ncbi:MAG: hypothetical protein ABGX04_17680 [Myxococcales bacterium]|nr:Trm112 family protein [Myxococcales bacterium]HIK84925.1 Trm112 family protein [Myxococcales bacterium]
MPIDNELLEILVCPESRQTVALASAEILEGLNSEIAASRLRNRGGDVVEKQIEEGLLREDRKVLYIVDDSIPIMLIDQSIELS